MSLVATPASLDAGWLERLEPAHARRTVQLLLAGGSLVAAGAFVVNPVFAFAVVFLMAGGLAVLWRPAFAGYVLAAAVPVTSGFRRGFPVPGFRLSELLIGGLGTAVILFASKRQAQRWRVFDWLALAYALGWTGFGLFNAIQLGQHLDTRLIGTLFGQLQYFLLYRAVVTALPALRQRVLALRLYLLCSVPVGLLAVLQELRAPGVRAFVRYLTGSSVLTSASYHYFTRATGPFPAWTPLAGYLLVLLLLGLAIGLDARALPVSRLVLAVVVATAIAALILSAELSAIAGLIGGAIALGIWYGHTKKVMKWLLVAAAIGALAFGAFFAKRLTEEFTVATGSARSSLVPQTLNYRWKVWTGQYFPAIAERPFSGYGLVLPARVTWPYTESQYVTLLMQGGIFLMAVYLAMMYSLYRLAKSIAGGAMPPAPGETVPVGWPEQRSAARALAVLVVVVIIVGTIFPYFTDSGLPQAMWVLAALVAASAPAQRTLSTVGSPPEELALAGPRGRSQDAL